MQGAQKSRVSEEITNVNVTHNELTQIDMLDLDQHTQKGSPKSLLF